MELHIFDFDGTLFHSPVPNAEQLQALYPSNPRLYDQLMLPECEGGIGWLQNVASLSPPAVPLKPDADRWFIGPVLQHFRQLIAEKKAGIGRDKKFFVLTGRQLRFQQRIEEILDHAGLLGEMDAVFLKPHDTYGNVVFKLEKFADLLGQHHPEAVFYYEDRPEQGAKLLLGVHQLQSQLFYSTRGAAAGSANPINPLGGGDQGHALPPQGSCHLVSFTAAGGLGSSAADSIDLLHLFRGRSAERKAMGALLFAERWAVSHCQTHGITAAPSERLAKEMGEKVLAPFQFTMALVEPRLGTQCQRMLSDTDVSLSYWEKRNPELLFTLLSSPLPLINLNKEYGSGIRHFYVQLFSLFAWLTDPPPAPAPMPNSLVQQEIRGGIRFARLPATLAATTRPHWILTAGTAALPLLQAYDAAAAAAGPSIPSCYHCPKVFMISHLTPSLWSQLLGVCQRLTVPERSYTFSSPGLSAAPEAKEQRGDTTEEAILNAVCLHVLEREAGDFEPNNMVYNTLQQPCFSPLRRLVPSSETTADRSAAAFATYVAQVQQGEVGEEAAPAGPDTSTRRGVEVERERGHSLTGNGKAQALTQENLAVAQQPLPPPFTSTSPPDAAASQIFYFFPYPVRVASSIPFRSAHFSVLVNLKPIVPHHLMLVPHRCIGSLQGLHPDEVEDFGHVMAIAVRVLNRVRTAEEKNKEREKEKMAGGEELVTERSNYSVAIQQGPVAGQTVAHLHIHLIPFDPHGKLANTPEADEEEQRRRPPRTDAEMGDEAAMLRPLFEAEAQRGGYGFRFGYLGMEESQECSHRTSSRSPSGEYRQTARRRNESQGYSHGCLLLAAHGGLMRHSRVKRMPTHTRTLSRQAPSPPNSLRQSSGRRLPGDSRRSTREYVLSKELRHSFPLFPAADTEENIIQSRSGGLPFICP
eukprot:gene9813-6889_t